MGKSQMFLHMVCSYSTPQTFQQILFGVKMDKHKVSFAPQIKLPKDCSSFYCQRWWQLLTASLHQSDSPAKIADSIRF
jgi:hypothetical protein